MRNDADRATHEMIVVFSRFRRRVFEVAPTDGISPTQRSVLSRLSKEGPATTSELATAERVRPQSMAATVAVLQDAGLVGRSDDPGDGRRKILSLTKQGRELMDGLRSLRREWLTEALRSNCTAEELATVREALSILGRVIES
jgi:DNA-binding MarR family transcriptional regulator